MSQSTKNLRVLRSYLRLPPMPGGMEKHIASLSAAQREIGVEVVNVHNTGEAKGLSIQILPNIDLRKVKPAALRNAIFYRVAAAKVAPQNVARKTALHIHGDWSDFLLSKMLARRLGVKVVAASVHGTLREAAPWLYRRSLSHCDPIFVTGKVQRDYLQKTLNREVHHLPSAPLDVFFDMPFSSIHAKYDVIAVSNMFPIKRTGLIIECAARRPELHFVLSSFGVHFQHKNPYKALK